MPKGCGFTHIELLVAIAVAAILLSLALPGFAELLARQRLKTAAQSFLHTLQFARMQAVYGGYRVCVVHRNTSWRAGWTVFSDRNSNCEQEPGEASIFEHDALPDNIRTSGAGRAAGYISYQPDGQSVQLSGAFQATSVYFCPANRLIDAFRVVVSKGGRIRLERLPAGSASCEG